MKLTVYSTGCPKCTVLEKKLQQKGLEFDKVEDIKVMRKMGFMSVPHLVVDDQPPMDFTEAINWVNSLEE